jgi:hypothetical protein
MTTVENIEAALERAFVAAPIDREVIDEPTSLWDVYDEYADLVALEGKTWRDVPAEFLVRHPSLLVYAGDALFRAMLPAYLRYLLHERAQFNAMPFQVAGQLERGVDPELHPKFDRRVALFVAEQRAAVRDVLTLLATVRPLEEPMAAALETWKHL